MSDSKKRSFSTSKRPWETELDCVTACGKAVPPEVVLHPEVYSKITAMMQTFPRREWLGFLVGEANEREVYVIDLVIPDQEADSTSCETKEPEPEGCVGVIHSHHSMGTFFSRTDQDSVNLNNPVSVVVSMTNGTLEFEAVAKTQVACGAWAVTPTEVRLDLPKVDPDWINEARSKVRWPAQRSIGYVAGRTTNYTNRGMLWPRPEEEEDRIVEAVILRQGKEVEGEYECPLCHGQGCNLCEGTGVLSEEQIALWYGDY